MMDAIASMLFALVGNPPQAAPAPPAPPRSFTQVVRVDLGLASAVGLAGLTYSIAPATGFLAELGVGVGFTGLQLSAMPKLVLGTPTSRFVVGVGASLSIPGVEIVTNNGPMMGNENERVVTPWLNAEIGYDHRSKTGAAFLVAGGITVGLAHGCAGGLDSCSELDGLVLPQIRVGFGQWF